MASRRVRVAAALTILLLKKKKRSIWVREWISRRREAGVYHNLLREIQLEHGQQYFNFIRMIAVDLEALLVKVGHVIKKQDPHFRDSISPKERLVLTLRFLASGKYE